MKMRLAGAALISFAFAAVRPAIASAQFVRGVVNDRAGAPVAGVVTTLLDSTATAVANSLSNDRGEFSMRAPRTGTYTMRSLRIGYSATVSPPFVVASDAVANTRIILNDVRLQLQAIRVAAKAVCQSRPDAAAQTFALWEQARAAITATDINASSRSMFATTVVFERSLERSSQRITRQTMATRAAVVSQPWTAFPVETLLKVGYVTTEKDTIVYAAPGLDMLSSDAFLEGHCLRLAEASDTTQIGIAFEPVRERRGYSDIRGTLWLDRSSAELRKIEFGYTNLPSEQARMAGGEIHLARLKNGAWAIARWSIRMPAFGRQASRPGAPATNLMLIETRVTGGELALITTRSGARGDTLWVHQPLTMRGTVSDSATGRLVAGAQISLVGTAFKAVTDDAGKFSITGVLPGEYTADIRSPVLRSIGAGSIASITFLDSSSTIAVRVATAAQVLASICPRTPVNRNTGAIIGTVAVGVTAEPPANVRVLAEWREIRINAMDRGVLINEPIRYLDTKSDYAGVYHLCGVPLDKTIRVRAVGASASSLPVDVTVPMQIGVARAELLLATAASRTAVLTGVVTADSSSRALSGAEIVIPALGLSTRADAKGEFRLTEIPPGTHKVIARSLGYASLEAELTFAPNQTDERTLHLYRVTVLDSMTTTASAGSMRSFDENRSLGLGRFLTREDLAKKEGQSMASVITQFAGADIKRPQSSNRAWLASSRGAQSLSGSELTVPSSEDSVVGAKPACYAHIWIDGVQVYRGREGEPLFDLSSIAPKEIEAIEYYTGPAQTPSQYSGFKSACGVLVIWKRR